MPDMICMLLLVPGHGLVEIPRGTVSMMNSRSNLQCKAAMAALLGMCAVPLADSIPYVSTTMRYRGASSPEKLVERRRELELTCLAYLADLCGAAEL